MPQPLSAPLHPVPVLETARLWLRGYYPSDFELHLAMCQEPDFYRHLSPGPMPAEEVWGKFLRTIGHWTLLGYGFWAIEEKASGSYIGSIGFADFKRGLDPRMDDVPEIGWVLAPAAHGKGYASEAVAAALAWGQEQFADARTVCIIDPDNTASLNVAAKFGYREFARSTYKDNPIVLLERPGTGAA
ncbi:GNAT family N-acetyltransferase [Hymenobacter saemangeumensis]|uniref:GNAT family N-acetyltransferase n=1 Tax=Hymenobacter saemangeumensis TaxID=1084522 RepID=UPI0031E6EB90